jgi:hypothetical protein
MSEQQKNNSFQPFATAGACTGYGGRVTSGSGFVICGLPVACVGDIVTYADGAGAAWLVRNQPAALREAP